MLVIYCPKPFTDQYSSALKLQKHLEDSMKAWRDIQIGKKGSHTYGAFHRDLRIMDDTIISMRLIKNHNWLSCWVSGSDCIPRSCPGKNGNWQKYSNGKSKCRGEIFWITNKKNGE